MKLHEMNGKSEPKTTFGFTVRKQKRDCIIYLTVKRCQTTHKLPIGVKCGYGQFNKKTHLTSDSEKNTKLLQLQLAVMQNYDYLCTCDINGIRQFLNLNNNIVMNNPKPRTPRASKVLCEALETLYASRPSYAPFKVCLNRFLSFLEYLKETDNRTGGDSMDKLKLEYILAFRQWLLDSKLAVKTINDTVNVVCRLVNGYVCENLKYIKYHVQKLQVEPLKNKVEKNDKKVKLIPAASIEKLKAYKPQTKAETRLKDIALLLLYTGLRYNDAMRLLTGDYVDNNNGTLTVKTQKKSIFAHVILNDEITRIMQTWKDKPMATKTFDEQIKKMWAKFDNDTVVTYQQQKGNEIITVTRQFAEEITAHCFRHTFITLALDRGEKPEDIAKMVGHNDTTMINKVYGHLTAAQENRLFAQRMVKQTAPQQPTTDSSERVTYPLTINILDLDPDLSEAMEEGRNMNYD